MSILPVWVPVSVRNKTHFANSPRGVRYLIGTVSTKEIDPWKKIPLRAPGAPAARENAFRLLHKPPKNDCLEIWYIKISKTSWQKKSIHEKKPASRARRAAHRSKTCSAYYISPLKTIV